MDTKVDIKSLNLEELKDFIINMEEKPFRAEQIFNWLCLGVVSFDEMTNISKPLRQKLENHALLTSAKIEKKLVSEDKTVKYLFSMWDNQKIEAVVLRYKHGNSICISTQVGCSMGCAFCASTVGGRVRNLSASEMLDQIHTASKDLNQRISNVVMMGIGEPLDNYDNVLRFLQLCNNEKGLSIGHRHISISTCGLVDKIDDLAKENLQITLSVSLHAPFDEMRSKIMPVNKKFNIDKLIKSCHNYIKITNRRISFEYAMINGFNDTRECAVKLSALLSGMLCHVNLIPINDTHRGDFKPSTKSSVKEFMEILKSNNINVTLRRKLGDDIMASCGQLRRNSNP